MPNHVLYGTAFAAETNVSVEECKCYCMNAEKQYGMECRSIEYYFDSRTCLLNNLSRTTNPKNFNHSIASRLMHSYFDKNCSTQNDEFLTYTKEKCLFVTNLAIVNTNSSLNFTNKIDSDRNAISQSDKVTSAYNNNNRDLTDGLVISKINLIHFTEYATPSNYDDLSQEVSKEEDKDKKSEKVSELQHSDLTTPHATTIIPANENFTDFTTISDSSSEPNNTTAILGLFYFSEQNFDQMILFD
ncbi:PAN domain family protein [Acanthocheilonema viteae]